MNVQFYNLKKGTCFKDSKNRLYYIVLNRSGNNVHTFWIRNDSNTEEDKPTYNILDFDEFSWGRGGFEDKTVAAVDYKDRRLVLRYLFSNNLTKVKT